MDNLAPIRYFAYATKQLYWTDSPTVLTVELIKTNSEIRLRLVNPHLHGQEITLSVGWHRKQKIQRKLRMDSNFTFAIF